MSLPQPHQLLYPRCLEQCLALNDRKEWFVPLFTVESPEAKLYGQSVCKLTFLFYPCYLFSRKCCFYLWSIIIIQINVFKKWIRSVLGDKRYLGENVGLVFEVTNTKNPGIWVSSEELIFFSFNWAKDLKPEKAFLPENILYRAWINICWIELSLWNRSLSWLLVDT